MPMGGVPPSPPGCNTDQQNHPSSKWQARKLKFLLLIDSRLVFSSPLADFTVTDMTHTGVRHWGKQHQILLPVECSWSKNLHKQEKGRVFNYGLTKQSRQAHKKMNRPFSRCLKLLFQSEAKCEAIDMITILYSRANKIHFREKGFALSLVLKVRVFESRKCLFLIGNQRVRAASLRSNFHFLSQVL